MLNTAFIGLSIPVFFLGCVALPIDSGRINTLEPGTMQRIAFVSAVINKNITIIRNLGGRILFDGSCEMKPDLAREVHLAFSLSSLRGTQSTVVAIASLTNDRSIRALAAMNKTDTHFISSKGFPDPATVRMNPKLVSRLSRDNGIDGVLLVQAVAVDYNPMFTVEVRLQLLDTSGRIVYQDAESAGQRVVVISSITGHYIAYWGNVEIPSVYLALSKTCRDRLIERLKRQL